MSSSDDSIHFLIISTTIFIVATLGIFGNVHVVLAVKTFPELRSKNGVLLCHLACYHCVCLAFETLSAVRMRLGPSMTRRQCYSSIFIYSYTINHQCCLVLVLVCDIAFCLLRPLRFLPTWIFNELYHSLPVSPYVHIVQIPCYIFSFSFLIVGFLTMDDEIVLACNPPLSYSATTLNAWNASYLIINAATVIIYSTALAYTLSCGNLNKLAKPTQPNTSAIVSQQRRLLTSLSALLVIFCFSWFLGAAAVRGPMIFDMDPRFVAFVQTYAVIPAILSYAQTYYIYFCVSREYRAAFMKLGLFGLVRWKRRSDNVVANNSRQSLWLMK